MTLATTCWCDVLVLSGAGVGGGSLVHANATRMLGATTYPRASPSDAVMRDVAEEMGVGHTYRPAEVGVVFGAEGSEPGEQVDDPYFGGAGPARHGCLHCGECMTGCRHDAKNTLVKNYLYLAEAAGAQVHAMTTVTRIRPRAGDLSGASGYEVEVRTTGRAGGRRTLRADQVVVAASALGSQRLLHRLRRRGDLPRVSARLGELSRTNSEAILAARSPSDSADVTRGVSITSSIHPDAHTHVEPARYGRGSNLLALLSAVLVDGTTAADDATRGERGPSWRRIAGQVVRSRKTLWALHRPRRWAEQSIVLLVMQTLDNSLTLRPRRFLRGLTTRPGRGAQRSRTRGAATAPRTRRGSTAASRRSPRTVPPYPPVRPARCARPPTSRPRPSEHPVTGSATTYPPEPWTLVGRMDLSTFLVPTRTIPTATWPDGWRPLAPSGRTPVGAAWVDYAPGGVLSYRELLVAVAGRVGPRVRPHIVAIWVDSPASRDGGRELWGIPKGLATFDGVEHGRPSMTVKGHERPGASAVLRHGARLPGRPRTGFTLAQDLHRSLLESPVTTRAGLGLLHADWTFAPDGPLAFLAGHRPLVSATLHDFAMLFGMTPHDRARVGQPGGHAGVERQKSPHVRPATT